MILRQLTDSTPFITRDGSTIRSLLDRANAPVANQSLAEATVAPGCRTAPHYHRLSEEFYYVTQGRGVMDLDGEAREIGPGDAILIPPGSVHTLRNSGATPLVILCCCAPPYAHEDTILVKAQ